MSIYNNVINVLFSNNLSPASILLELIQYSGNETSLEIKRVLDDKLDHHRQIKGIFVPSSASFLVAEYLESKSYHQIHLVGFDAHESNLEFLKKGTIDFLIDQDPFEQGFIGIKVLFDYLLFKKIPEKIYNSPINIVTRENASFFKKPMDSELIA